jgi:hypothetical protein
MLTRFIDTDALHYNFSINCHKYSHIYSIFLYNLIGFKQARCITADNLTQYSKIV